MQFPTTLADFVYLAGWTTMLPISRCNTCCGDTTSQNPVYPCLVFLDWWGTDAPLSCRLPDLVAAESSCSSKSLSAYSSSLAAALATDAATGRACKSSECIWQSEVDCAMHQFEHQLEENRRNAVHALSTRAQHVFRLWTIQLQQAADSSPEGHV